MMPRSGKWLIPLAVLGLLGGCAVPQQQATTAGYGAVTYAPSTQDWRLRWKAINPQRARQRALTDCAVADCRVVLEFGPGQCGTLALNPQGVFGVGQGATANTAETVALNECRRTATGCRVVPAECND